MDRRQKIQELWDDQPSYKLRQVEEALFQPHWHDWDQVSTLSKDLRQRLTQVPWTTLALDHITETADGTKKALLTLTDGYAIECVLLPNARDNYTICLSSQAGCAMRCQFCATGYMGLERSLTNDEIVDQYRFWADWLEQQGYQRTQITNLVYMGMGEPMANYEAVRDSLNLLLEHTEIGPTRITVSTVGVMAGLRKLLADETWPSVRVAISLHSAIAETRLAIVPTHQESFYQDLTQWAMEYHKLHGNRRHYLSFEYVLLGGLNDDQHHAKALITFLQKIENPRVNLIPYNAINFTSFKKTPREVAQAFQRLLVAAGIPTSIRRSSGQDIAAACGQLAVNSTQ